MIYSRYQMAAVWSGQLACFPAPSIHRIYTLLSQTMEEIYWDSATHQAVQLKQLSLCLAEILQQHLVRHLLLPLQAHPLLPRGAGHRARQTPLTTSSALLLLVPRASHPLVSRVLLPPNLPDGRVTLHHPRLPDHRGRG